MKKLFLIMAVCLTFVSCSKKASEPKYVFYFIGDGMGLSHVAATRAALACENGVIGFEGLSFTGFPVTNFITTHCATRLTTDSAAAGTALATGTKTYPGAIGVDVDKKPLKSIAYDMKEWGRKVGIITTVSIDHATPASFYAHQPDRGMTTQIARELPQSGFDLFVGGGFVKPAGVMDSLPINGYTLVRGRDAELKGDKVVWIEREGHGTDFSYAADRKPEDMTLPEVVEKSINYFGACKEGFFMMIEGGKIDWAAHGQDGIGIVKEVEDLSEAVQKAVDFYNQHPDETLIVVTADHETGGFALGRGDRAYDTDMKLLLKRKHYTNEKGEDAVVPRDSTHFKAGVAFTSGTHTAQPVPLFALGTSSERFSRGNLDNTDIAKILRELHAEQTK